MSSSSTPSTTTTALDIVIPTTLVAAMSFLKNILIDEYLPESPHLWLDVALHTVAQLVASTATVEFIVPAAGEYGRIANPLIHGGLTGLIKENFLDTSSIASLRMFSSGRLPKAKNFTFETGFLEGLGYGSIASGTSYAVGF